MCQKGVVHVGGANLPCEKRLVPRKVTSNKEKHFLLLEFTSLTEEPIMCCIIFDGVAQNLVVETGADFTKLLIGHVEDPHLFEINFGDSKLTPGSPT